MSLYFFCILSFQESYKIYHIFYNKKRTRNMEYEQKKYGQKRFSNIMINRYFHEITFAKSMRVIEICWKKFQRLGLKFKNSQNIASVEKNMSYKIRNSRSVMKILGLWEYFVFLCLWKMITFQWKQCKNEFFCKKFLNVKYSRTLYTVFLCNILLFLDSLKVIIEF